MNFPLYIAKRYLFSKSSNNAINIIAAIAVIGVVVGTLALSIVLAGFSGLKTFSLSFINASDPDLRISIKEGKTFLFDSDLDSILSKDTKITSFSKAVEERAFYNYRNKQVVAYLKGVDDQFKNTSNIPRNLIVGNWVQEDVNDKVVVGNGISGQLALGILNYGDPLRILVPKPGQGYISNVQQAFNLVDTQAIGVFASSEELDQNYVFTNLATIQKLLGIQANEISQIDLRLSPGVDAKEFRNTLLKTLGPAYQIKTRQELNDVFYRMLNTENLVSYLIFTFIVIIALFNVIGAIIMMILDKKQNLKTITALGARVKDIKRIFILQGFLLTQVGLYLGLGISVILLVLQKQFKLFMITSTLPYPVEFEWTNFAVVWITISVLGYIAAQIASSRINTKLIEQA